MRNPGIPVTGQVGRVQQAGSEASRKSGARLAFRLLLAVAFAVVLAACSSARQSIPSSDSEPAVSASEDPTGTPASTPSPVAQPSPTPSPEPTTVPTPTPEPTHTPVPEPTPEPTPTPEPVQDPPFPVSCGAAERLPDADLREIIDERIGDYSPGFGVVVHELRTGAYVEINPQQSYYGASLYKTAVMYEVLRQVESGILSLDQYVTIDAFYASQDLGTTSWEVGTQITVLQALEAAITYSDNATAYLLGDLVGWFTMDSTLHDLGAVDTQFSWDDLPTTAADMARVLEAIACMEGVTEESSQLMLELLARQYVNNRLPLYLPERAVVAHKTGDWSDANHDIGIVYGPNAVYVIAVLSAYPGADDLIALLSRDVYEYFHPEASRGRDGPSR